jgi:iron complex outermembrane receptor protein
MKIKFYIIVVILMLLIAGNLLAQTQQPDQNLYDLSLEDLMKIPIKSASKKEETLFDAPLSSYTITRAEIDKAGSASIMEALRLAPGVIVREQANGVYDIHIRGMENLTRNNYDFFKTNAYTLVMIDNRPVFNHSLGGTFWESIPVDINDVDRIEIVRGPSSPLFGPNAVTGVINIITKRMGSEKSLVSTNIQLGNLGTTIANASVGRNITDKLGVIVSANYQDRQRIDQNYYNESTGQYVPLSTLIPSDSVRKVRYPHPSRSFNKWGINGNVNYKFSDKISVDLTLSREMASSQRIFASNPLTYTNTNNTAANLAINVHALKIRTSYLSGYNSDNKTSLPSPNGEYDYKVADAVAEYDFKVGSKYTITPGISYQQVKFDDRKYVRPESYMYGYLNAARTINTTAGFIRTDLNFTKKLRVLAGLRVDKFSVPDKAYFAYEFASTYKFNDKNLVRVAVTRSNSGSFMGYNYVNVGSPATGQFIGDSNLKLLTINMIELGYRAQITSKLQLDIDVFQQEAKNLTAIVAKQVFPTTTAQFSNIPTTATQRGATISFNYVPMEKIQFKPFVTFQKTETKDLPSAYVAQSAVPFPITYSNSTHKYTPGVYGGFYLNYKPVAKFNINLNGYYMGKQSQYDPSWSDQNKATAQYAYGQFKSKYLLNAKVSYEVLKGLNAYINARNAFGSSAREFYAADQTAGMYLLGASYNFNK